MFLYHVATNSVYDWLLLILLLPGAQACVVAYSIVDRDSFEAVEEWKKKVCKSTVNSFISPFR